ncbi:MAG TPA: response regulator [Polyangiaceae bacterium]|nr:response regulator [Polyangiaceae bacterium]
MKQTFLVVDDDPIALEVARERLEQLGFEVTTRLEVLGTSTWIAENEPDFILLDVMMPALSGSELAKVIKRRDFRTGIILYSSKPRAELDALVRQTGALGAIGKDCDARRFSSQLLLLIGGGAPLSAAQGKS